ncbi:MAG: dCTP deaminase [Candidatus Freyarchaeota archaeon]|nr:dCTP deaminase [Candidatus Freyrarchaeum guaymaensis]
MTVLSKKEILERIFTENENERLVITPLISKDQISASSVDVRLGTEFIITKRTKYSLLDPAQENIESEIEQYQEKIHVPFGEKLILRPHQLILGSTLEYIKLPRDLIGYVIGRSSWGRLGLIIATATLVNPGYTGTLTLELINLGEADIALYPGSRIAQLVIHELSEIEEGYMQKPLAKYVGSTGPEFSKIHKDKEWKTLTKQPP